MIIRQQHVIQPVVSSYLSKVRRQLQRVDATTIVADNNNGVSLVEADVRKLRLLHHLLFTERLVLVLGEVKDVNL